MLSSLLGLVDFLAKLFPSLTVSGEAGRESTRTTDDGIEIELRRVDNPYRQLVHLALHYVSNLPDRVVAVDDQQADWPTPEFIAATPRALIVVDLEPGAMLIPTAAEAADGRVHLIYPQPSEAPKYPSSALTEDELDALRGQYWAWMIKNFDAQQAMIATEGAAEDAQSRFDWIDYRMALWTDDEPTGTAHLHLSGRGNFPTGTFAYNMIKRAMKHGIRVIGVVKSEPDINVLAVFER